MYLHLEKLQLGSIDVAFKGRQYALKNSARANFFSFFYFYFFLYFRVVFIVNSTAKCLKLYVQVVNSIHLMSAEVRN
jgi:hypothetical protein